MLFAGGSGLLAGSFAISLPFDMSIRIPIRIPILGSAIVLSIFSLLIAVLYGYSSVGLWDRRNKARILAIIISVIYLINSIFNIFRMPLTGALFAVQFLVLIYYLAVALYLLFSQQVKSSFS